MLEDAWPDPTTHSWRRDRLPATLNLVELLDHLAHVVGTTMRRGRAFRRRRTTPTVTDPVALLLAFFRTCVRDGVYEPRIPCHAANSVNPVQVGRRVRCLAEAHPDRYAVGPRDPTTVREPPPLTEVDVARLEAACRTHAERAFLALVSTTGLRACAIGAARVADVFCTETQRVRDSFTFDEKNSQVRTVWPTPELQSFLAEYLQSGEHPGEHITPFLFPSPRRPRYPSPSVARNLLRGICARVVPAARFSPHQFQTQRRKEMCC